MAITDWCVGSYGKPSHLAARQLAGPGDPRPVTTGLCPFCKRRVVVRPSGRLRRHRKALSAAVAAMNAADEGSGRRPPRRK